MTFDEWYVGIVNTGYSGGHKELAQLAFNSGKMCMRPEIAELKSQLFEIGDGLRLYLSYGSLDGKPIRQELRKQLAELVGLKRI